MSPLLYTTLWILYLLGVVGFLLGAWRISRRWPFVLQRFGRLALLVLLLTPAPQSAGREGLAPAFIAMLFDQLQDYEGGWFRAGIYLVISGCLGLLIFLGSLAWHYGFKVRQVNRD